MPRFRPLDPNVAFGDLNDLLAVSAVIDEAMRPGNFFVAPELCASWIAARRETIPWEIFRGRLLDASQTREQASFLSWHVIQPDASEPTISVKLDINARQIHVTRAFLAYQWEGYDAGGGVMESREAVKWQRELVGTMALADFADLENLRDESICLLWQAIVGTSRLPLASVEAPLPAFVLGQLHYVFRSDAGENASVSWIEFLQAGMHPNHAWRENVKLVEFALRQIAPAELPRLADALAKSFLRETLPRLFRSMFNAVSLSPFTRFAENALALIDVLAERGTLSADERIDFLGFLLRQLGRHLTAYDLITFHQRGANYPDALVLDLALKKYLHRIDASREGFLGDDANGQRRRRALRQACLLRKAYEGHLVPDLPTSPGENARVMPASHPRVSEEQLTQTMRRQRQLYAADPLADLLTANARHVLEQSVRDLEHPEERKELGLGVFIDRPLGYGKETGAPDLTPLLAHEAFSPSLARRRWGELKNLCEELELPCDTKTLDPFFEHGPWPVGLPHVELAECPRPTAALSDVRKVAGDFVILQTLGGSLTPVMERLLPPCRAYRLAFLRQGKMRLCVQAIDAAKHPALVIFDDRFRRRLELSIDGSQGYVTRAGVEWPRAGLRVTAVWQDMDDPETLLREEPTNWLL